MIEATAGSVRAFAGGALLYEIGYTGSVLFMQVFIADMTSLRNRLLGSFIPSAPDIITVWVSGNLVDSVLSSASWTWGIGAFDQSQNASLHLMALVCRDVGHHLPRLYLPTAPLTLAWRAQSTKRRHPPATSIPLEDSDQPLGHDRTLLAN